MPSFGFGIVAIVVIGFFLFSRWVNMLQGVRAGRHLLARPPGQPAEGARPGADLLAVRDAW